jgi:RNA polymerase sigma-70 factor, ECF subfamily
MLPESALVAQARAGNHRAFGELARRHSAMIFSVSYRMLRNREDAEDNLQNVLFKAYLKIHQFEGASRFSTWLTRIAINEAMMQLRKLKPEKAAVQPNAEVSQDQPDLAFGIKDSHADPEREYIAKDLMTKALSGLATDLRDTFVLHQAEGWAHPELAKTLGIEASSVKSRVFRARTRLRRLVQSLTDTQSMRLRPESTDHHIAMASRGLASACRKKSACESHCSNTRAATGEDPKVRFQMHL